MEKALCVSWLLAYSSLPIVLVLFALIFSFEGFASLHTHPGNLGVAVVSALFLVAWPASALLGWLLLCLGKTRSAWLVTGGTALTLVLLWLLSLVVAASAPGRL